MTQWQFYLRHFVTLNTTKNENHHLVWEHWFLQGKEKTVVGSTYIAFWEWGNNQIKVAISPYVLKSNSKESCHPVPCPQGRMRKRFNDSQREAQVSDSENDNQRKTRVSDSENDSENCAASTAKESWPRSTLGTRLLYKYCHFSFIFSVLFWLPRPIQESSNTHCHSANISTWRR